MLYIFDTDHLTLYQHSHPLLGERIRTLDYNLHRLATTVINCHEQISGRFEQVQRARNSDALVAAYQAMKNTIEFFEAWEILAYSDRAETHFKTARKASIRIGTMDLRIASIALALDATVVTRNRQDFQQVPTLKFEDWSIG
jgi:tRNA(fMet)-specific endonuclease VapC